MELTMAINFISPKDNDEERTMHSKIDYMEVMLYDNSDEAIQVLFDSPLFREQTFLET